MRRFNPHAYGTPSVKPQSNGQRQSEAALCSTPSPVSKALGGANECRSVPRTTSNIDTASKRIPFASLNQSQEAKDRQECQTPSNSTFADSKIGSETTHGSWNGIDQNTTPQGHQQAKISHLTGLLATSPEFDSNGMEPTPAAPMILSSCQNSLSHKANYSAVSTASKLKPSQKYITAMTQSSHCTPDRDQTSLASNPNDGNSVDPDLLNQARRSMLKGISLRNKAKDKNVTTSLRDLDIARKSPYSTSSNSYRHTPVQSSSPRFGAKSTASKLTPSSVFVQQHVFGGPTFRKDEQPERPLQMEAKTTHELPRTDSRPVGFHNASDASGSPIPSNASDDSKGSIQAVHSGKANNRQLHPLVGWDGSIQPPPSWHQRPAFDVDPLVVQDELNRWTSGLIREIAEPHDGLFQTVPAEILQDVTNYPDGISMVARNTTISKENASRYGYTEKETEETIRGYTNSVAQRDFDDWGKLDLTRSENYGIRLETTEDLVKNWVKHKIEHVNVVGTEIEDQEKAFKALFDTKKATPHPHAPKLNVYLRAACETDIVQMNQIYNWYIENSPRPAETSATEDYDMVSRLDDVTSKRFPFIVAVENSARAALSHNAEPDLKAMRKETHPIHNVDAESGRMKAVEKIVGWACAQNMTAADYVERVSAELEIYVDPEYRQLGIGGCLMDKLLEACDRGHMKRGGYQFFCPQERRHHYSGGGGCDLHKLYFIVRKWKHPKVSTSHRVKQKHPKLNTNMKSEDQENDCDTWVKTWIEKWGFEVEGVLKGAGAKNGRFIDLVQFGKETSWQPAEGHIPDPLPGTF